jgi:hypothetical protein
MAFTIAHHLADAILSEGVDGGGSMSDARDNLVLERLREIRALLGDVREDTADTRLRVGMLEAGYASISLRLDRLAGDVERIKRRVDLVETP